ncbi:MULTISPECIES: glycine cleavage system aminomethyltransferase GcvT [Subtercola]|uniref:Aminomethyltransferase n=1 Tax=Subtercola vilae TaxID=2056433 RepID=A0A4T2C452_9MICO|nr:MULTISPECIES: glycine cleavage system aminomethyltransferase GcvT [Subtercola]MEA9986030.1 glycine cleavage system aminomethyltransferase GcvT [Subtercola sp. RTI3]TIH36948.1 glycine cleavage system aminomethyltransferase GcvT [Subtercola vilae]
MTAGPLFSPLHDEHVAAGASFTDFAGWQMPVRYSSDLTEHHAVRTAAGLFDLSHMAEILVSGIDAPRFLDYALAGKISATKLGQAKYSLLLTEQGGIVDDLVVYRTGDERFLVVANAGNHEAAVAALSERATGFDVDVRDVSDETALIAVQGPLSRGIVEAVLDVEPLHALRYYWSVEAHFGGHPVLVARTGYTGEDGFELYIAPNAAPELWAALVDAGESSGMVAAGLASRDTLRLEAGMPLYGHELGLETRPADAGLGRVPNFTKGEFVGRTALESTPEPGAGAGTTASRVLVGLIAEGKRAARAGYELFESDAASTPIGVVTSGILSPTLGVPIAMAYVDPAFAGVDTPLSIDIRGKRLAYRVTEIPFYSRKRDLS